MPEPGDRLKLFTVGHSNHSADRFLGNLATRQVDVLVDVRSWPGSRFAQWADRKSLPSLLRSIGCSYVYLGQELGGRPEGDEFYDAAGHVLYGRVAKSDDFRRGMQRLMRGLADHRVAVMCSEEDPTHCHRRLLVSKVMSEAGVEIAHIRGDGRCEVERTPIGPPETLFDSGESTWISSQSVSRGPQRRISSAA
jgi:uncharacterized protein (DUF488 family)